MSNNIVPFEIEGLSTSLVDATKNVNVNDLSADNVTLVSILLDSSGSMSSFSKDVIDSFNECINAWKKSKTVDEILVQVIIFDQNIQILYNFRKLENVPALDRSIYKANGLTALYDAVSVGLKNLTDYSDELQRNGIHVNNICVVLTDGEDNSSRIGNSDQEMSNMIKSVVSNLMKTEIYTLAVAAFGSGADQVPVQLGFPNVLKTGISGSEIRKIFNMISKSVSKVSSSNVAVLSNSFFS